MKLAFYRVGNSVGLDRHSFDSIYDQPEEVLELLSQLSDEELMVYNFDNPMEYDAFQEDYNDEVLDGGWWCVIF